MRTSSLLKIDKKNQKILRSVFRAILFVNLVSLFATLVGTMIDGIIISRFLGKTATGAFGLTNPLFNFIELIAGVVASGNSVLCGRKTGEGNLSEANQVFSVSVFLSLVISGAAALLMLLCAGQIVGLLGASAEPEISRMAVSYLRGFSLGVPALVLMALLSPLMQLEGDKNRALLSVWFSAA